MPTFLINTNLSAAAYDANKISDINSNNVDSSSSNGLKEKNIQDDFREDLNSIISKLLAKSETMDSFLIKYDIDDLLVKNTDPMNNNTSSKCICERLTNLFSEVLTKSNSHVPSKNNNNIQNISDSANKTEIKEIYTELRSIRKYQSDLSNKFNLVINKLDYNNSHSFINENKDCNSNRPSYSQTHEVRNGQIRPQQLLNNSQFYSNLNQATQVSNGDNSSKILTGAKKRKHSSYTSKNNKNESFEMNEPNEISQDIEDFDDREVSTVLEDSDIQHLMEDEDIDNTNNLPSDTIIDNENLSEKLFEDHRDCPSRLSSTTNSSKHSKKANSNDSNVTFNDFNNDMPVLDDLENDLPEEEQLDKISNHQNIKEENIENEIVNKYLEDEFITELDANNCVNEKDEYLNEQNYAQLKVKEPVYSNNTSINNRNNNLQYDNIYNNPQNQNKQSIYTFNTDNYKNNNNYSSLIQKNLNKYKQATQGQQLAPNQKFRFIDSSPNPVQNRYPQKTYYPIPHHQSQHIARFQHQLSNTPNRPMNSSRPANFSQNPNSNNNLNDTKFNSKQNLANKSSITNGDHNNSLNGSRNSEPATEIDINELFKNGGPRFLQMELYKNFKPPVLLIHDKYFIDNMLASSAYSKSKSRRNFAAHLAKLVFTPRERLESNCNGRFGKKALDTTLLMAIRNTLFKFYPCNQSTLVVHGDTITSGDHDENNVWLRDCIPAIDESNRVLKKQLIAWYKKQHSNQGQQLNVNSSGNNNNNSLYSNTSSTTQIISPNNNNNNVNNRVFNSSYSNMVSAGSTSNNNNKYNNTSLNEENNEQISWLVEDENNLDEEFEI